MTEMNWFEDRVINHRKILIAGYLLSPRERDDDIGAYLSTIQMVKLAEGCYVFVGLSYKRLREWDTHKDVGPSLEARTQLCATVEEVLKHWRKEYFATPKDAPHDTVSVSIEIGGPPVKHSDPWFLYHLGALTEMARASQELAAIGDESQVTVAVVGALEALTTARIKQLTDVVGRR